MLNARLLRGDANCEGEAGNAFIIMHCYNIFINISTRMMLLFVHSYYGAVRIARVGRRLELGGTALLQPHTLWRTRGYGPTLKCAVVILLLLLFFIIMIIIIIIIIIK